MKLIIRQTLDWDKQELREIEFDKVQVVNVRDIYDYISFTKNGKQVFQIGEVDAMHQSSLGDCDLDVNKIFECLMPYVNTEKVAILDEFEFCGDTDIYLK